jgi:F-type H+-transporting ATPase subunit c
MSELIALANAIAQALPTAETAATVSADVAAQSKAALQSFNHLAAGIALGLAAVGGGLGIAIVGAATVMGISRQPEQAGALKGLMFVVAALIEGLALIAMVIGLVLAFS